MEKMTEKKFVCKFCNKKFPSGKSLGGHIRIHTTEYSVGSDSNSGKNPKKKNNKRLGDQRDITYLQQQQQEQLCCRECGKGFDSLNALCSHCEGEKMVMDSQSDTDTTSSAPTMKRSKKVLEQSNSESFSSSSASEIDQEHKNTALSLMMMSIDSKGHNLVANSVAESSDNNSEILETKASSGEQLKMIFNVKDQDLETDNVAVDDSYSSDSDYFMNGPKKSDSDVSVDMSLRNTGLNRFRNGDELEVKERGSKYELRKSKRVLPSYESDSYADTNIKIHRSSDSKLVKKASGANRSSKGHECPICFKVFKSGQALGGHKRSHFIGNHEQRIKHKAAADMRIDLNLPAQDADE
ncbi:hypothetical protein Bca52824_014074 [Brassica carinata]|uniref:C2H2-type domain-containing protein n=1 Tax=Brassica carinata TaxID=52824 RepID=A0A8X7W0K2_BRACI|nr:hypothetical protein Bca52824_014074 [Brassica carinata]